MALAALSSMPAEFFAGDTVKLSLAPPGCPAPDWVVTLAMSGPAQFTKAGAPNGAGHLVTLATDDTAEKPSGVYVWALLATETATGDRVTLGSGSSWMKPNPASGSLSYAQECLALLRAYIKGQLPAGLTSHTINGNQISKMDISAAVKLEQEFAARVAAETRAAGGCREDIVLPCFTR